MRALALTFSLQSRAHSNECARDVARRRSSVTRRARVASTLARAAEDDDASAEPRRDDDDVALTRASSALSDVISSPLFYVTFGVAAGVVLVQRLGENAAFALSAFPIVGLTAISKTDFGAKLRENIEERRPGLERDRTGKARERAEARGKSEFYGAGRRKFLGDVAFEYPAHLTGELCGDVGFDPLGFGKDPKDLVKFREYELLHGRWAMLGVVGAALPEALQIIGAVDLGESVWWKVGAYVMNSDIELNYLGMKGFHIAGGSGIAIIAACQLVLMGGPEYARKVGIESLVPVGVWLPGDDVLYPGGAPFDPFKFSDNAEEFEKQKVMEIKHARLAMLAWLGIAVQAIAIPGTGPVENLLRAFGHE